MSVAMRPRGAPIARFATPPVMSVVAAAPTPRSGSDGGYPWHDGELLYAADLNAAITAVSVSILDLGAKGDGVTDDTAAIQSALNTFASKATVYIPNTGAPYICSILNIPTDTDLLIHGTIMQKAGQATALVNIVNVNTVTIRGHGIIDGNRANQTTDGACCVASVNASNIRITGVTVQNAYDWNINITSTSNCRIDRVTMLNCGASNEFAAGCDNCWITDSTIDGVIQDGGWTFYGGVTNSGITGCIVKNAFAAGIGIYSDRVSSQTSPPCANIVIADNLVYNNNTGGIALDTDGLAVNHTGVVISGNRCYANNNIGNHTFADIWVGHGANVTITGNALSGSGSGNNPTWGVFVAVQSVSVNITGNTIWNEGQGGAQGAGVYVQGANRILISGNYIFDDQTTPTMTTGIAGNAGAGNYIIGNLVAGITTSIGIVPEIDTIIDESVPALPLAGGGTVTGTVIIDSNTQIGLTVNAVNTGINVNGNGIGYNNGNAIAFQDAGATVSVHVDGDSFGNVLTDEYAAGTVVTLNGIQFATGSSLVNAVNDAAAAGLGVPLNKVYRNGSILMVRVT